MALATLRRAFRRWRVARAIRAARRTGHGLYLTEWHAPAASLDSLSHDVTNWCRDTLASCRRPMGIDHFDLTLTIHAPGRPHSQRHAFLRPVQLYDESVIPATLAAAIAALATSEPEVPVRIVATLLSWGDVAYASMS